MRFEISHPESESTFIELYETEKDANEKYENTLCHVKRIADERKPKKKMTLEEAKIELKNVCNKMKEIKKKNKIGKRTPNMNCLHKLFIKYHKGKFINRKVYYKNHQRVYSDPVLFLQLMLRRKWLFGFITSEIYREDEE